MSWACANCTTENDDSVEKCVVCGADRTRKIINSDQGGTVFFSGFDAFKYSLKKIFGKTSDSE